MARSLLAVAGLSLTLSAAAAAQPTWNTQLGFAETRTGPLLPGNSHILTATGTYTFIVRAGIFDLTGLGAGQSNQGLNNLTAWLTTEGESAGESLGLNHSTSRFAPFVFGPTQCGWFCPPQHFLMNAARDVAGGASAAWPFGDPVPTAPAPGALGVESLTNVFRFTYTVNTLAGPDVLIRLTGTAGPVLNWSEFGRVDPEPGTPGTVNFIGIAGLPLRDYPETTLTLIRCGGAVTQPATHAAAAGFGAAFTTATTAPGSVAYRWRRNGVPLTDDGRISGATTSTLTIAPVRTTDAATYTCVLSGPCPTPFSTEPAELIVTCPGDYDHNGVSEPADIALFLNLWFNSLAQGTLAGDFDNNGQVQPADVAAIVAAWFYGLANGC